MAAKTSQVFLIFLIIQTINNKSMYLIQDRNSRSLLSGELCQKIRNLRLKRLEDDDYNKYLSDLHSNNK